MIRALFILPALQALFFSGGVWAVVLFVSEDRKVANTLFEVVLIFSYIVASRISYDHFYEDDEDDSPPPKPPKPKDDWLQLINVDSNTTYYGRVPIDELQLRLMASRFLGGDRFAMDRWEPWMLGGRDQYKDIRKGFLDDHILEWANPAWRRAGLRQPAKLRLPSPHTACDHKQRAAAGGVK